MKFSYALSAFALAALSATSAQALTPTGISCSITDTVINATACAGAFDGNNLGNAARTAEVLGEITNDFGGTGWALTTEELAFTSTSIDLGGAMSGPFVLALKADGAFSLYYYDASVMGVSSLDYVTSGVALNVRGFPQDLSHASLYTMPVPEPETYALMLAGLGAVGFIARRRKA